jgi:hypothetical protein
MSRRALPGHPPQHPDGPSPTFPPQISLPQISSLSHTAVATSACPVPNPTQFVAVVRSLARRSTSTTDHHGGDGDIASPAAPPPDRPTSLDPWGALQRGSGAVPHPLPIFRFRPVPSGSALGLRILSSGLHRCVCGCLQFLPWDSSASFVFSLDLCLEISK